MVAHTTALFSEYTQAVSFVHVNAGVVFLLQADNFGQIGQVTFHGKYSIHNNQLYSIRFAFLEFFFQSLHIVMLVLQLSGKCKTAAIYNGSVVTVITNNIIPTAYNGRNNTFVYSKSGRKTECFIFSYEFSQFLLQFNMYIECSVQKAGTCTTGAIFFCGSYRGINDTLVICQSHICIRAEHQNLFTIHHYLCILMAVNCAEIRIYAFCHELLRQVVFRKFVL